MRRSCRISFECYVRILRPESPTELWHNVDCLSTPTFYVLSHAQGHRRPTFKTYDEILEFFENDLGEARLTSAHSLGWNPKRPSTMAVVSPYFIKRRLNVSQRLVGELILLFQSETSDMYMFESFLKSIPKNRSELVEELEIPEISLTPYVWTEPEDSISSRSDSFFSGSTEEFDKGTISTDSSIPLSRAMTDSEIDYGWYKRYKSLNYSDPWDHLKAANDAFPPDYLASLNSFISTDTAEELADSYEAEDRRQYNEELRLKMERFFDEECRVFTPDDPGLLELQEAVRKLDLKALESKLGIITAKPPL